MEKEIQDLRKKMASGGSSGGEVETKTIGDIAFASKLLEDVPGNELKSLVDDLKAKVKSGVVALVSVTGGKVSLVVGVTKDLIDRFNAVDLVRVGSNVVGGKGGGGRPDMAQAGGPNGDQAQAALDAIEAALQG